MTLRAFLCLAAFGLLIAACDGTAEPDVSDCEAGAAEACRQGSGGPPVDTCRVVDKEERCVYRCETDSDCDSEFYPNGCVGRTDDGTDVCE